MDEEDGDARKDFDFLGVVFLLDEGEVRNSSEGGSISARISEELVAREFLSELKEK